MGTQLLRTLVSGTDLNLAGHSQAMVKCLMYFFAHSSAWLPGYIDGPSLKIVI